MMDGYARAVAADRRRAAMGELATYVRWEYGPGTGLGYFLAELGAAAPQRRTRRSDGERSGGWRGMASAVASAFASFVRRRRARSHDAVRVGQ